MGSRQESEGRAFEALIVSLLGRECNPDKVESAELPALTAKEKSALAALGPDLVEQLWEKGRQRNPKPADTKATPTGELVMNRAEDIDEDTAEELERRRAELIERMKKLRQDENDG